MNISRHKASYFASLLLLAQLCTNIHAGIGDSLRLGAGRVADLFMGMSDGSEHRTKQVDELRKKMGIQHHVPVKKMSLLAKLVYDYTNSFAALPGVLDRLYINEDWFEELTEPEIEFILASELARIKNKAELYDIAYILAISAANTYLQKQPAHVKTNVDKVKEMAKRALLGKFFSNKTPWRLRFLNDHGKWLLKKLTEPAPAPNPEIARPANVVNAEQNSLNNAILTALPIACAIDSSNRTRAADAQTIAVLGSKVGALAFLKADHHKKMRSSFPWYRNGQAFLHKLFELPYKVIPLIKSYNQARARDIERAV